MGLTERDAPAKGYNIRVAKLPMSHVARAIEVDETRGFMKAVVDADTDQILGCAILDIEVNISSFSITRTGRWKRLLLIRGSRPYVESLRWSRQRSYYQSPSRSAGALA